jgi:hypothetical protein
MHVPVNTMSNGQLLQAYATHRGNPAIIQELEAEVLKKIRMHRGCEERGRELLRQGTDILQRMKDLESLSDQISRPSASRALDPEYSRVVQQLLALMKGEKSPELCAT